MSQDTSILKKNAEKPDTEEDSGARTGSEKEGLVADQAEDVTDATEEESGAQAGSEKEGSVANQAEDVTDSTDGSVDDKLQDDEESSDDLGAALLEDELWDEEGDLDEIQLFDDVDPEESDKETQKHASEGENLSDRQGESPSDSTDVSATEEDLTRDSDSPDDPSETAEVVKETCRADKKSWVSWTIAGVSGILLIAGLVILWNLTVPLLMPCNIVADPVISSSVPESSPGSGSPKKISVHGEQAQGLITESTNTYKSLRGFEIINLAPFLIPAQRAGELIFLKLQVELIVSDAETKDVLLQKEALVRDTIYGELKGVNVNSFVQGNFLMEYRRPIVKHLNQQLAPLKVEEIRLMGFLMK